MLQMLSAELDQALAHAVARCALWVAVVAGVGALAALMAATLQHAGRAPRLAARLEALAPGPIRRAAAALVAVALTTLCTTGAASADSSVRDWLAGRAVATPPLAATPPAAATAPPSATPAPTSSDAARAYVVRPGDCLWSIAAAALGPRATNRRIDGAWRELYTRNRSLIGDDPNLIYPGTALALPPSLAVS